ncbi:MAG: DUF934 domain-containing protein [Zoogloeaceae bacterium]|jgi:uncharacterized protein (DUF934 family)|nr:DUF934 domain-containing protein [Zoogloeaceae bacterium]
MSILITAEGFSEDVWQTLPAGDELQQALPEGARFLFPLAFWQARRAEILARYPHVGLWLEPDAELSALFEAGDLPHFEVIAIHFPRFADGRGYSLARLLRERGQYAGELRAVGDVLHDQLFAMRRVGFDAWVLKDGKDAQKALSAFATFQNPYQGDVRQAPLFRRRNGTAA